MTVVVWRLGASAARRAAPVRSPLRCSSSARQRGEAAGILRQKQKVQAIAESSSQRDLGLGQGVFTPAAKGDKTSEEKCDGRTCEEEWQKVPGSAPGNRRGSGHPPRTGENQPELSILEDNLWTFVLISPLVVSFWRGGWELMDVVFYPGDHVASAWASLVFGMAVVTALKLLEPKLARRENELADALQERAFTFSLALGGIGIWHGVWHLYDEYLNFLGPVNGPLASLAIGTAGLLCARNLRSVLPVPSAPLALDDDKTYGLHIGTLKSALKSRGWRWLW